MRIVFMGSGRFACPIIQTLLERPRDELVAVVTQPDRPGGRSRKMTACPVGAFLKGSNIPVLTPEKASAPDVVAEIAAFGPDVIVVADFGQFLKPALLSLAPHGAINVHPSLLPRYRGAAPIQWALANGETETGATIMYMNERMDAGDIIMQEKYSISEDDTALSLEPVLAGLGASLLNRVLDRLPVGDLPREQQDESQATFAPKLKKEDGRIDWRMSAHEIYNRIRAFAVWPGVFCEAPRGSEDMVRIHVARVEEESGEPGVVLDVRGDGPLVACGKNALRLLEVQPEGKRPMPARAYLNGHPLHPGTALG